MSRTFNHTRFPALAFFYWWRTGFRNILEAERGTKLMDIVLTVPDSAELGLKDLRNGSSAPLPRRILELATIRAYEMDSIGEKQVMDILGIEDREELYAFFKANQVKSGYTIEDLERDSAALAALLGR